MTVGCSVVVEGLCSVVPLYCYTFCVCETVWRTRLFHIYMQSQRLVTHFCAKLQIHGKFSFVLFEDSQLHGLCDAC